MLLTFLLYIIPMLICFYMAFKVKTDRWFARAIEIRTYAGLWILVMVGPIPMLNFITCLVALCLLCENKYFKDIEYKDETR